MAPYSTLEVHSSQHVDGTVQHTYHAHSSRYPEVAPGHQPDYYPEVVPQENPKYPVLVPVEMKTLLHIEPGKEVIEHSAPEAVNGQFVGLGSTSPEWVQDTNAPGQGTKRICGLRRRWFWTIIAIKVIVAVVIATTLGVILTRPSNNNADAYSPLTNATAATNILSNSSLTAINFTDSSGYNHRMVFFEDGYNAIVARRWDSQNTTWATSNLTLVMSNSPTAVEIAPGAALAAAGVGHQVELFLVDAGNTIRSLYNGDVLGGPDHWQNYTMNATLVAYPGSRLAATAQACGPDDTFCSCALDFCTAGWVVAFQQPGDGALVTTNYSSAWAGRQLAVNGIDTAAATSLALVTQYQGDTAQMGLLSEGYVSGTEGAVQVANYDNHTWALNDVTKIITDVSLPASSQYIAASKWRDWSTTLSYVLLSDGTLKGKWWNASSSTTLSSITLDGAPDNTNFTNIAMTDDAVLYGVSADEILEFSVDSSDPATLHYVGKIFPA